MKIRPFDLIVVLAVVTSAYFFYKDKNEVRPPIYSVPVEVDREDPDDRLTEEEIVEAEKVIEKALQKEEPVAVEIPKNKKNPKAKYPNLDDSFTPFDEEGNRYVTQINQVGEHLIYHGDVLIGHTDDLQRFKKSRVVKQARAKKWPGGVIPYMVDESLPNFDKVMEAFEYMNLQTNLQFVPREAQKNYISVERGKEDCYSYAGMIGGKQEIYLTNRCGVREILHELMHSIGFFHEQNREDRDQHVQVLWDNIAKLHHPQFKKLPNDFIGLVGRPFDANSIMMYSSYTFANSREEPAMLYLNNDVIPQATSLLSDEDIDRVNIAYPRFQ